MPLARRRPCRSLFRSFLLWGLLCGGSNPARAANDHGSPGSAGQYLRALWTAQISTAPKALALGSIHLYQKTLSPLLQRIGVRCIYTPSCSHYACEAIRKQGVLKGLALAGWRVLRCNQFAKGGYDPVPEPRAR